MASKKKVTEKAAPKKAAAPKKVSELDQLKQELEDVKGMVAVLMRFKNKAVPFLEKFGGKDLDGDGKIGLIAFLMISLCAGSVLAQSAASDEIIKWDGTNSNYVTVFKDGSVEASGGFTGDVTGDLTGDITGDVAGDLSMSVTAANWTDGSTNTVAAGVHLISGTGGANDTTNTVVLANPAAAGDLVYIIMAATTTNLVTIADSGNVAASSAILLDANDSVTLVGATTSLWVEVSASDN